jgi:hypothetical protein
VTYTQTRAAAAVKVAAGLGVHSRDPVVLADGANVIVHLSPAPVVAKVAASTTAVRPSATWLQRELDVVGFLAGRGVPVMTPPLQDIPSYLARPQSTLTPAEAAALAAAHARLITELGSFPGRPLHGDAGAGNLMATGPGWVWHDFEDTCSGPLAWDVAASTASQRLDARRVLAAYGEPVDPATLAACEQLRRLHLTVWYNLYAERLPELRPRAAELLALWPPP